MILTMAKYHENLLRDSPLPLLSMVNFLSSFETKMILKIPTETFLRITRYICNNKTTIARDRQNSELVKKAFLFLQTTTKFHRLETVLTEEELRDYFISKLVFEEHLQR